MKNKKLLLLVSVLTIAVVASVILWLVFTNSKDETVVTNTSQSQEQNNDSSGPQLSAVEKANRPDGGTQIPQVNPREESFSYTDQIISPDTIASNPDSYIDKRITTRGWLVESNPGTYILTSINVDEKKGLVLATNVTINFSDYTITSSDISKSSKPVSLSGTFSVSTESGNYEFIVGSLDQ